MQSLAPRTGARPYQSAEPSCGLSLIQSSKRRTGDIGICHAWLSKGRDAMKTPDYIAIAVLIVVLVWAVADQLPRGKL